MTQNGRYMKNKLELPEFANEMGVPYQVLIKEAVIKAYLPSEQLT